MPAFLKDIRPFLGTGEKNEDNQTLEEFLEAYDPYIYKNPSVTADVLVIRHPKDFYQVEQGLQLLMIKRRNHPSIGQWALPGGFVNVEEDIEAAAKRELEEETGLSGLSVELVSMYGEANRDPRSRIVTAAYVALVQEGQEIKNSEVKAGDDAADACFFKLRLRQTFSEKMILEDKEKIITRYKLTAVNEEKDVTLSAMVERSENEGGLLKEKKYKVISSEGLAFDHPRFIVETLLYLRDLLK